MKRKVHKLVVLILLFSVISCDEPETVVTNIVHPDGSVTRRIEMRSLDQDSGARFKSSALQVTYDDTWDVRDSLEISDKGDTTWVRRAEKLFGDTSEINMAYKSDSGANKNVSRHSSFERSFKWFNTEFRFSEIIDKELENGYPLREFLNSEELLYFYSPEELQESLKSGSDSIKYKVLNDSVDKQTLHWVAKNIVSQWIGEFSKFTKGKEGSRDIVNTLKSHEDELSNLIVKNEDEFDSLWTNGTFLKKYIGEENFLKFNSEADSAAGKAVELIFVDFKDYSVRIAMPGKVIGTNGFIDSSQVLLWPVKSDFFLTESYEMWAESKVPNMWAWIISGLFVVFVLTGVLIRIKKKG